MFPRFYLVPVLILVGSVVFSHGALAQTTPEAANQAAYAIFLTGDYEAASAAYEKVLADYPTSAIVSAAQLQLAYSQFFTANFDKSLDSLKKLLSGPPLTPALRQAALSLEPQAISAKASMMEPGNPARKTLLEQAVVKFTEFLKQFPTAEDAEQVVYGRALANFQLGKFDDAIKDLEENVAKFSRSPTISSSQNLLALAYASKGSLELSRGDAANRDVAFSEFKKSTDILRRIISEKTDLTLVNDAYFQLGEILFNQASFSPEDQRQALYSEALKAYRNILPKDQVVLLQQARVDAFPTRRRDALARGDRAALPVLDKENERELRRLSEVKSKTDPTANAFLKMAEIFYNSNQLNASRVLLTHLSPFLTTSEQKKRALYFTAMSYALQNAAEPAVTAYQAFQSEFKGDPIAQNLPFSIGSVFLSSPDPKVNNPEKAIEYFQESLSVYPKGNFAGMTTVSQALAQSRLGKVDESLRTFEQFLATNPRPAEAVVAQLGMAGIYKDTQRQDQAIAAYKTVIEKYGDLPQATDAQFWIAVVTQQKGDNAAAIQLLKEFVAKHPDSPLVPTALFQMAAAQVATNAIADAITTFAKIASDFPDSPAAPFTYFQRAQLLAKENRKDEMLALMKQFIEKYPNDDKVFFAYDSIAQADLSDNRPADGLARYKEFAEKYPESPKAPDALMRVVDLQRNSAALLGRYVAMPPEDQQKFRDSLDDSIATGEDLIKRFPDDPAVALATRAILEAQRLRLASGLIQPAEVETYFMELAESAPSPGAKSKTLFTLAVFLADTDKAKALETMKGAYDPALVYAPADLDFYGIALIDAGDTETAGVVFDKLATDYPLPPGTAPNQAVPQVRDAQAMALFGKGRIAQEKGDVAAAGAFFEELKTNYPWSPKILEANYGIAESLRAQKKPDDALALLTPIIRATNVTPELPAKALLLGGFLITDKMNAATDPKMKDELMANAIDYFLKVHQLYSGVPAVASQGLWQGAQLLEVQAAGITDPAKKKRQSDLAIRSYGDLVREFPNSELAPKAQERLAALQPK